MRTRRHPVSSLAALAAVVAFAGCSAPQSRTTVTPGRTTLDQESVTLTVRVPPAPPAEEVPDGGR